MRRVADVDHHRDGDRADDREDECENDRADPQPDPGRVLLAALAGAASVGPPAGAGVADPPGGGVCDDSMAANLFDRPDACWMPPSMRPALCDIHHAILAGWPVAAICWPGHQSRPREPRSMPPEEGNEMSVAEHNLTEPDHLHRPVPAVGAEQLVGDGDRLQPPTARAGRA